MGLDADFGDATGPEFLASLPLNGIQWIVLAAPALGGDAMSDVPRMALIEGLRRVGYRGAIAVMGAGPEDWSTMEAAGPTLVLDPFRDAAQQAAELMAERRRPSPVEPTDPLAQVTLP